MGLKVYGTTKASNNGGDGILVQEGASATFYGDVITEGNGRNGLTAEGKPDLIQMLGLHQETRVDEVIELFKKLNEVPREVRPATVTGSSIFVNALKNGADTVDLLTRFLAIYENPTLRTLFGWAKDAFLKS